MSDELISLLLDHLWLHERLAKNTLAAYRSDLTKIAQRLAQHNTDFQHAQNTDLIQAIYVPSEHARSQARALAAVKKLYHWLNETEQRADNPTRELKIGKQDRTLPPLITEQQIDALLNAPNLETPHGLRDKAFLELLYATGLRVSEAVHLSLNEINLQTGMVNTIGKGKRMRRCKKRCNNAKRISSFYQWWASCYRVRCFGLGYKSCRAWGW